MRAKALLAALCAAMFLVIQTAIPARANANSSNVAVINVGGIVGERDNPLQFFGPRTKPLRQLVGAVDSAATDDNIGALMVRFDNPVWDMAQATEFHDALMRFRESGKPSYAIYSHGGLTTYVASTAADEIVMPPLGLLNVTGVSFSMYYIKDLLEKLGVEAEVVQFGEYKDAAEPFAASEPSEPARQQMELFVEDVFSVMRDRVAAGRGVSEEEAEAILTGGPYSAERALANGVIDRIAYPEEMKDVFEEELETVVAMRTNYGRQPRRQAQPPSLMQLLTGGGAGMRSRARTAEPNIAVVYALGMIVDGSMDETDFLFSVPMIADEDFVEMLDEVVEEEGTKAIVLRISSPGGSASASDRIWNKIEEIRARDIPVVVSMGGVAASGGYYIGMGGDRVLAEPATITGSIGVIGAKIVLGGTYEKIGVNRHQFAIGENVGLLDESRHWTERERELVTEMLQPTYDQFVSRAAQSRGMDMGEMDELAEGRLWSGLSAQRNGLVDELGGLSRAISIARELADAPDAQVREYPRELGLFEMLEKLFAGEISAPRGLPGSSSLGAMEPAVRALLPESALGALAFFHHSRGASAGPAPMLVSPWLIQQDH